MFYFLSIILDVVIIYFINLFFVAPHIGLTWYVLLFIVLITFFAVLIIDALCAFATRWLFPYKRYNKPIKSLSAFRFESRFLEKTGIKKWKDKVPELGKFTNFSKGKIAEPKNAEYILRFITEANFGVLGHFLSIPFGFLIILIYPKCWFSIGFPIAFLNLIYNLLPLEILRYNLTKLHKLYQINLRNVKN